MTCISILVPIPALPVTHLMDGEEGDSDNEGGGAGDGSGSTVELEFNLKTYLMRYTLGPCEWLLSRGGLLIAVEQRSITVTLRTMLMLSGY